MIHGTESPLIGYTGIQRCLQSAGFLITFRGLSELSVGAF
jgi:hypothetical protein